jgi:multidrug efflux pump subunit AcrA (membrane-fusion protein)
MTGSIESSLRDWLALQCERIPGTRAGILLLGPHSSAAALPAVSWPDGNPGSPQLRAAATAAIAKAGVVEHPAPGSPHSSQGPRTIASTFECTSGLKGSVAILLDASSPAATPQVVGLLRSGAAWLEVLLQRDSDSRKLSTLLGLVGIVMEHEASGAVATSVATELATRLEFERVSIGFQKRREMRVEALSHSATFDPRTNLIRDLGAAMDEAADQDATITHPPQRGTTPRIAIAHQHLARQHGAGAVCTVPFAHDGQVVGAFSFERSAGEPIDTASVRLCEDVSLLLGGMLRLARKANASPVEQAREWLQSQRSKLMKPGHPKLKLAVLGMVAAPLLLCFAPGDYRVTAPATLEGRVQRAVVAGIDGYIAEAHARAGDLVSEGQLLGRLDDRDLLLEGHRAAARRDQIQKEYRQALAVHDRPKANIMRARFSQSNSELELLREQLARTRLLAPFDGVVVKGDLSQVLGSPVGRGELLFEVAPLNGYRIILNVDERDISVVAEQRRGTLTLSALPDQKLALTVERITPVAVTVAGRNTFRVEASLDEPVRTLRPGMEGVAKIYVGRRRLFWIWTHQLVDWLRLWTWSWWP